MLFKWILDHDGAVAKSKPKPKFLSAYSVSGTKCYTKKYIFKNII